MDDSTRSGFVLKEIDPLSDPNWDRTVLLHPQSTVFHSAAWAQVLVKSYGHTPIYLQYLRNGEPCALFPMMEVTSLFTGRRGVSLPFSDFCQPLLFDDGSSKLPLTETLLQLGRERKWRYVQLRDGSETLPADLPVSETYYGHTLDLTPGCDRLFARFDSSVRRAIRKAGKSKLVVEIAENWKSVLDFYKLHVRTRRRHGLPPQPLSFFRNIYQEIIKMGLGFVVSAKHDLKPIAAAVFFNSAQQGLYKFGASDERLQNVRGNNLVMWEGIKRLAEKRLKRLHLGRTAVRDEGLRRFKLAWGTQEEPIKYSKFVFRTGEWDDRRHDSSGLHNQLFSRLPLTVNRLAGALVYRHLD